jgi:hypothetical protein
MGQFQSSEVIAMAHKGYVIKDQNEYYMFISPELRDKLFKTENLYISNGIALGTLSTLYHVSYPNILWIFCTDPKGNKRAEVIKHPVTGEIRTDKIEPLRDFAKKPLFPTNDLEDFTTRMFNMFNTCYVVEKVTSNMFENDIKYSDLGIKEPEYSNKPELLNEVNGYLEITKNKFEDVKFDNLEEILVPMFDAANKNKDWLL